MAAKLGRKGATNPKVFCGKNPKAIFVLFLFLKNIRNQLRFLLSSVLFFFFFFFSI